MIRFLPALVLAFALAACTPPREEAVTGAPCEARVERAVSFSDPVVEDVIEVRAQGPSCAQARLSLSLRGAQGGPLWSHEAAYVDLAFGGPRAPDAPAPTIDSVQLFLEAWAQPSLTTTGALPDWPAGAAQPGAQGEGLAYDTPLSRDTYVALRAADRPAACFATGVDYSRCIVIENGVGAEIIGFGP